MFEEFLDGLEEDQRWAMAAVVDHVAELVPEATEGTSYGMPAFRYRDRPLLGMAARGDQLSLAPFSSEAVDAVRGEVADATKGMVRFTVGQPLSHEVIARMVRARLDEIDA